MLRCKASWNAPHTRTLGQSMVTNDTELLGHCMCAMEEDTCLLWELRDPRDITVTSWQGAVTGSCNRLPSPLHPGFQPLLLGGFTSIWDRLAHSHTPFKAALEPHTRQCGVACSPWSLSAVPERDAAWLSGAEHRLCDFCPA